MAREIAGLVVGEEARVTVDGQPLALGLEVRNHSPKGFQWGYGGSGPAQLALAKLLTVADERTAETYLPAVPGVLHRADNGAALVGGGVEGGGVAGGREAARRDGPAGGEDQDAGA